MSSNQKKRLKPVRNWRRCWKWFSMQAMLLAGAIQGAWVFIPGEMRATIPEIYLQIATGVLLVLGVLGRLVDQGGNDEKTN